MEISFTFKIIAVFLGILLVWVILMIPINRFLKRQQIESEAWTDEAIAQRRLDYEANMHQQTESQRSEITKP